MVNIGPVFVTSAALRYCRRFISAFTLKTNHWPIKSKFIIIRASSVWYYRSGATRWRITDRWLHQVAVCADEPWVTRRCTASWRSAYPGWVGPRSSPPGPGWRRRSAAPSRTSPRPRGWQWRGISSGFYSERQVHKSVCRKRRTSMAD